MRQLVAPKMNNKQETVQNIENINLNEISDDNWSDSEGKTF